MQGLLLSLYPKAWREQYGEEYAALLEDTGMSVATVLDVAKVGCLLRLRAYEKSLIIIAAASLYALSGVMCIRLGLTENWPIWIPTNLLQTVGLVITLAPFVYALYFRLSILQERRRQWRENRSQVFWLVVLPLTALVILLLAFMCSCLMLSTGLFGIKGDMSFVRGALGMAAISGGLIRLLNILQGRLLERFAM